MNVVAVPEGSIVVVPCDDFPHALGPEEPEQEQVVELMEGISRVSGHNNFLVVVTATGSLNVLTADEARDVLERLAAVEARVGA